MKISEIASESNSDANPAALLKGYFVLDGARRELIWFGEVERFVTADQVAMAHLAARANKSTVIEWHYDGISPLLSDCSPVKRQFDGNHGYVETRDTSHTECCDIRFVQRLAPNKELLLQIFDLVNRGISDNELRARAQTLFHLGMPLSGETYSRLALGFKATFWDNGVIEVDERAIRYAYHELVSNADVYDFRARDDFGIDETPSSAI